MLVLLNGGNLIPCSSKLVKVALADVSVTEWRTWAFENPTPQPLQSHSLMLVLLNGGDIVPVADLNAKSHSLMLVLLNGGIH